MRHLKLFEGFNDDKALTDFQNAMNAPLLRKLMNVVYGGNNKTASSRATGARKSLAGDYMYRQDRGAFDAFLADIKTGENKHMWEDLFDAYKKTNESKIFESSDNKILVCVDIQEGSTKFMGFKAYKFMEFLNDNIDKYDRIIYLFNGQEMGYGSESDLKDWMLDNDLNEDLLDKIEFVEKTYGWFRFCMDKGLASEIGSLIKWMYNNNYTNLEDLDMEAWDNAVKEYPEIKELLDMKAELEENGGLNLPIYLFELFEQITKSVDLVGGQEDQCLGEIVIILDALDIKYKKLNSWIY